MATLGCGSGGRGRESVCLVEGDQTTLTLGEVQAFRSVSFSPAPVCSCESPGSTYLWAIAINETHPRPWP